jgi:hypothetical protein
MFRILSPTHENEGGRRQIATPENMIKPGNNKTNEKGGGVKKQATVRIWFRIVAINVCLIFNVAVVFFSTYFRFLFVKLS